jgi:hypothetical protein
MSDRGTRLLETADAQIAELTATLSTRDEAVLALPCPGREKLGDGTIAACAQHTAETYHRIAGVALSQPKAWPTGTNRHDRRHSAAGATLSGLLDRLSAARHALAPIAELTDPQLDTVPPAGTARFCDGQRTLEQVLTSMLNHQSHQIDAIGAAIR